MSNPYFLPGTSTSHNHSIVGGLSYSNITATAMEVHQQDARDYFLDGPWQTHQFDMRSEDLYMPTGIRQVTPPLYTPVAQLAYSQAPTGFGNTPTLSLYDGLSLSAELSSAITRPAWNAPPAPASLLLQALHGPLVRCCWSTCNVPLDDVTAGGINRHLQEYHLRSTRSVKEHTVCQWHTSHDVHPCGTQLRFANLGKHVAAIHLQTTASWCKRCGHSFSRTDALRRHEKQYCPQRLLRI